jgi:RNA binding exosome subunit
MAVLGLYYSRSKLKTRAVRREREAAMKNIMLGSRLQHQNGLKAVVKGVDGDNVYVTFDKQDALINYTQRDINDLFMLER